MGHDHDEQLKRQIEWFSSDDHIRREVAMWADATPEARLAAVSEMCAMGEHFASRIDDVTFEKVRALDAMPTDAIEILMRLRQER